jgi:hypothetical protein
MVVAADRRFGWLASCAVAAVAFVAGCGSSNRAQVEKDARAALASNAWIVAHAHALHERGAVSAQYVRVVARQNAADARATAQQLEHAGATNLAERARQLAATCDAVGGGDASAAARLEGRR